MNGYKCRAFGVGIITMLIMAYSASTADDTTAKGVSLVVGRRLLPKLKAAGVKYHKKNRFSSAAISQYSLNAGGSLFVFSKNETSLLLASTVLLPDFILDFPFSKKSQGIAIDATIKQIIGITKLRVISTKISAKEKESISYEAAVVTSYLQYIQDVKKLPLFGGWKLRLNAIAYQLPDEGVAWDKLNSLDLKIKTGKAISRANKDGKEDYKKEKFKLLKEKILIRKLDDQKAIAKIEKPLLAMNLLAPLRLKHLMHPISPQERFNIMNEESYMAEIALGRSSTEGQQHAFIFQTTYWTGDLEKSIIVFFRSRGLTVTLTKSPKQPDSFPYFAIHPNKSFLLIIGEIITNNGSCLIALSPLTATSNIQGYYEYMKEVTGKSKSELISKFPAGTSKNRIAKLKQFDAIQAKMLIAKDMYVKLGVLNKRCFILSSNAFAGWTYLKIVKVLTAANWWYSANERN